ncbi:MAG: sugar phosphate isomerase/epimerase [Oscillospiraceae bacterium]|nr:sugar phosphate isomerase/epimerase [Oscillospiraceae bacterium]
MLVNRKSIYLGCLPGATDEERFANAAEAGFAAIEPPAIEDADALAALKALYVKYNIVCPSVMSSGWGFPASSPDPEVRAKCAENYKIAIRTAVALGTDTILVVPGVVNEAIPYETAWENARLTVASVIPYAAEMGVYLAIENVWNKFLLSSREMTEFIDSFDSEWVKAYFDVGNILLYGFPQHWIVALGARIKKIHIKGFKRDGMQWTSLLKGDVNWQAVMDAFKTIGYDGWITAELGADERGLKGMADDMDYILSL